MPKFTGHLNESVEELHRYSLRKGELEPLEMAGLVGTGQLGVAVVVALEGWEWSDGVGRWNSWYEFEIQ